MTITLEPGVVGVASCSPPFVPSSQPHPIVIVARSQSGFLKVGWVSHSWQNDDKVVVLGASDISAAYASPSPLNANDPGVEHALVLTRKGRFILMDAKVTDDDQLEVGSGVMVEVTKRVKIPEDQWAPFRAKVFKAAGWIK